MIYKFTIVFLPAFEIGYCAVPDLLPPSDITENKEYNTYMMTGTLPIDWREYNTYMMTGTLPIDWREYNTYMMTGTLPIDRRTGNITPI